MLIAYFYGERGIWGSSRSLHTLRSTITSTEREGFGVPVANILFAPSTPRPVHAVQRTVSPINTTRRSVNKRYNFRIGRLTLVSRARAYALPGASCAGYYPNKAFALKFSQERSGSNPSISG